LIDVLATEHEKVTEFYRDYFHAVFPIELKINRRTEEISRNKFKPEDHPDWTTTDVCVALRQCQFEAKDEFGYDGF
jgi:hypothetical protein